MQVSVEQTSELSRKMTVSVPEEVVKEKMEERFKKLAREVKLDGFRPGKVPPHVVKKLFGDRVRGEVTGDLLQSTYFEALKEQGLRPAGMPNIVPSDEKDGFCYIAEFEVYPIISLDGLNRISVVRKNAEVEASDLDAMIENIRKQQATWNEVERASEQNDRITITFSGVCEGENFTNGKIDNYQVVIGAKQMIPGFEDNLVGMQKGEVKSFNVVFPEKYGNEKLAGKNAEFEVELVKVEMSVLPEIDAEFMKIYNIEDGNIETFRSEVKANMERELGQAIQSDLKNKVMDGLYETIKVTVPKVLVEQEIDAMMKPYLENAKKQKIKIEDLNLPRDKFEEQARRRVSLGLLLAEVIQTGSITVDEDRVRSLILNMAQNYERPDDIVKWYYSDEKRLDEVRQLALEDQAMDWLVAQINVTDEKVAFSEIMNKQQPSEV